MITKERLLELIEQGATIYSTHWKEEVDLSLPCKIIDKVINSVLTEVLIVDEGKGFTPNYLLSNLTEDIEGAKWNEEFGRIERTERLALPMWEEAEHMDKFIICEFDWYRLLMCPADNIGDDGWIGIDSGGNCEIYHWDNANKENYLKACRKCKELFLNGE